MHTGRRYGYFQTLNWSRREIFLPVAWATTATFAHEYISSTVFQIPWLPMSLVGIAVAFYLGFKNNASYDRMWEARKIWGAIVNASRTWTFTARDLVQPQHGGRADAAELGQIASRLMLRHVAWLDALRFQLRVIKSWEHDDGPHHEYRRWLDLPELVEDVREQLGRTLDEDEIDEALAQINPAARLLANQSRDLAQLRARGLLDGFAHMRLMQLLEELMAQQGKAERIKNFPFPRQYATVNSMFALAFTALVPFGMLAEFAPLSQTVPLAIWLTVPFSALVSWVFLTTDRIGDWSENPFEGMPNDVPISAMARGIERDIRQMLDETDLPPGREAKHEILL